MKVYGFSYIRNGNKLDYPFVESIQSVLPLVDTFFMVVGDSDDGSREAVEKLGPKMQIIDSVWDPELRQNGKIFAHQSNLGLAQVPQDADWAIHIQGDEMLHEQDHGAILRCMEENAHRKEVEGILFPYYHFWGYHHVVVTRRAHSGEIRIIRPGRNIFSYKDSQGFRRYKSEQDYLNGGKGTKLKVVMAKAHVYHYSRVRPPRLEMEKIKIFHQYWHDDAWIEQNTAGIEEFDYDRIDDLAEFKGTHPVYLQERLKSRDWAFDVSTMKRKLSFKDRILFWFEKLTGIRLFENKNYRLIS
ncbi:MAG: glycosyltransferase family 2 protein [Bacteroidia bacterium]|nr:glycosyltransferase family 2 protein [Bacteroidia bacterium]